MTKACKFTENEAMLHPTFGGQQVLCVSNGETTLFPTSEVKACDLYPATCNLLS